MEKPETKWSSRKQQAFLHSSVAIWVGTWLMAKNNHSQTMNTNTINKWILIILECNIFVTLFMQFYMTPSPDKNVYYFILIDLKMAIYSIASAVAISTFEWMQCDIISKYISLICFAITKLWPIYHPFTVTTKHRLSKSNLIRNKANLHKLTEMELNQIIQLQFNYRIFMLPNDNDEGFGKTTEN